MKQSLHNKMEAAGFKYVGEATSFCRFIRHDIISGISGRWIVHEFGGECFQPMTTSTGHHNNSCWERQLDAK